jgi:NTE family protein
MSDAIEQEASQIVDAISERVRYLLEQKQLATEVLLVGFIPQDVLDSVREGDRPLRGRDLEQLSSEWQTLIPDSPLVKAAVVRSLSVKCALVREEMPQLCAILGVDDQRVKDAYEARFAEALESAFTARRRSEGPEISPLSELLGGVDLNPLERFMLPVVLRDGEVLFEKGAAGDRIFVLAKGRVRIIFDRDDHAEGSRELEAFDLVGELAFLTGAPRTATVQAASDCELWYIATEHLMALIENHPHVFRQVFAIAARRYDFVYFLEHMRAFFGDLDLRMVNEIFEGSERIHLERGQLLFETGTFSKGWYLVTSGRLGSRASNSADGRLHVFEAGDSLGEEEILFGHPHRHSLMALAESEVIRVSPQGFDALLNDPDLMRRMFKRVIHQLAPSGKETRRQATQVIAVGALGDDGAVADVIPGMARLFGATRDSLFLQASTIKELLNVPNLALKDPDHLAWMRIRSWYSEVVNRHAYVLFALDGEHPAWNSFCVASADTIVGMVDATRSPTTLRDDPWFEETRPPLPKERWLILVHPADVERPSGTREWLRRHAMPMHLHIQGTGESELMRLMRMVTRTGVGVALGGGTARGFAHFGVMRALAEVGIPVDMVGGTSIASAIAAMFALRFPAEEMRAAIKRLLDLRPFRDYAFPRTALLKSRRFEQLARSTFRDTDIEDSWLKYFCISTNLSTGEEVVHETGEIWRASMASGALPVVMPPFIEGKHILVDGGLVNNVPVDLLLQRTQGPVIAVNVSSLEDWVVRENAPAKRRSVMERLRSYVSLKGDPGIMDILVQSMVVSSHQKLRSIVEHVDLYLEPPVGDFGLTQFEAMDGMAQCGYDYALPLVREFRNSHPKLKNL